MKKLLFLLSFCILAFTATATTSIPIDVGDEIVNVDFQDDIAGVDFVFVSAESFTLKNESKKEKEQISKEIEKPVLNLFAEKKAVTDINRWRDERIRCLKIENYNAIKYNFRQLKDLSGSSGGMPGNCK